MKFSTQKTEALRKKNQKGSSIVFSNADYFTLFF